MQILKELPDGSRVRVTQEQQALDKYAQGYTQLVTEKKLLIYSMNGKANKPQRAPRFGGRNMWVDA